MAGDATLAKVHLHTFDTDSTLAYLRSVGSVAHVKIDNIDEQHEAFSSRLPLLREVGVVAVVSGDGLPYLFPSLWASPIVRGGRRRAGEKREGGGRQQGSGPKHRHRQELRRLAQSDAPLEHGVAGGLDAV